MPAPKKYLKRVQIKSAYYPTYACWLTPWGKQLVKSVGHTCDTQTEYFNYLAKKHSRDVVEIRSISKALSVDGNCDFGLLPLYLRSIVKGVIDTKKALAMAKAHHPVI